ncbi:MAG: tRNA (adenosine(37)-N6)-threonylcarbamoyltransferase complex ATPase subunit type 1 TsaE [Cyclobacteriaceae bacterium]|nr:tRNA (adenosine(37)-N6)-threonylcarbamoyltransferase complex ATPase subunit type 1 TsaE [Cyclobacteriaceae bacterium]
MSVKVKASLSELSEVSQRIIREGEGVNIWLFKGNMGAGKTTLIKEIVYQMGSADNVNSPTFSIMNEYLLEEGQSVYHFDFYRMEDESEALDIGLEDFFYSGNLCLVEWPEKITNLIPEKYLEIEIGDIENKCREYHLVKHE